LYNEFRDNCVRRCVGKVNRLLLFDVTEASVAHAEAAPANKLTKFVMSKSSRRFPSRAKHRLPFYVQILSRSAASRRGSGDNELRKLGSARGSRACDGGLAIANFSGIP
jgi:hypothetical protein